MTSIEPGALAGRAADRAAGSPVGGPELLPRDDFDRDVWCVLGLPIDRMSLAEAVVAVESCARAGRRLSFVTPNVNWLVRALRDPAARMEVLNADLSLADGLPVVLIARLLGTPIRERTAGSDLFEALRRRPGLPGRRLRVFFLGGREGAAEMASARLSADRGGVEAAGWLNPGFGDVESMSDSATIARINAAKADFVLVSLGAAKGQAWIERNQSRLEAPVLAHLGAVVDFTAGVVKRSPALLSRLGLEWAFRIFAEPALWRRYATDAGHLLRILPTRLAPQLRMRRPTGETAGAATAADEDGMRIRLSGDLVAGALAPVRAAFREAVDEGTDIVVDFGRTGAVDRAFLGLMLMLEKAAARRRVTLRVTGLDPALRALFRANAMNYAEPDMRAAALHQESRPAGTMRG
jgi:N-acetylglucosaminyldiphosphoundecaprenol N-acetyl-beta-D-mannosaminyltransferase